MSQASHLAAESGSEFTSKLLPARQATLHDALETHHDWFPAIAVVLVDQKGLIHADAAGMVKDDDASPVSTVFPVASISKTVVAALCLQSCEKGEFSLDEDINNFLPKRCTVRNPYFPMDVVTARQLLMHRSSLTDDESALYPGRWRAEGSDCSVSLAEYVYQRFNPESEWFEPWSWSKDSAPGAAAWHYSNAGFAILGLALETVTGRGVRGLDALAKERLFLPLGMKRSSFFLEPLLELPDTQLALPQGPLMEEPSHYGVCEYPAASLHSSAIDLGHWLTALLSGSGGNPMPDKILSASSMTELLPPGLHCEGALAWWGRDSRYGNSAGKTWEHGGFMDGVRSHAYLWPQHGVGAAFVANGEGSYKRLEFEIKACMSEYLGIPLKCL